jgi:hypothetical protein
VIETSNVEASVISIISSDLEGENDQDRIVSGGTLDMAVSRLVGFQPAQFPHANHAAEAADIAWPC